MNTKEKLNRLSDWCVWIFMTIAYFVIGAVMAVPYAHLAGWNADYLTVISLVLPLTSAILYILHLLRRMLPGKAMNKVFYGFAGYYLLPVFANGISIVLNRIGLTTVGSFIFEYRYASLIMVPLTGIVGIAIYVFPWREHFGNYNAIARNTK